MVDPEDIVYDILQSMGSSTNQNKDNTSVQEASEI